MSLPTTHPYYKFSPSHEASGGGSITPSNIPGLLVWNRADTLAVGNGVAVGTWTNSGNASGPTITCTGTQSNSVLNGKSVVNFTTTQTWTSSSALTPSSYTFIQVTRQVPSTYGRVFQSSVAGTNQLHGYWNANKQVVYTDGWLGIAGGTSADAYAWDISTETRVQNGAFENRFSGATIYAGTTSPNVNLNGLAINTGGAAAGEVSTCQVAEVILYNSVLPKPQVLGIEAYLKNKWAI